MTAVSTIRDRGPCLANPPIPGLVIAGAQSGVGKTTIATGLMAALTARGQRVQPFKVGPDYIDPSYHTAVCGRPSRTLDGWMVGTSATLELYQRAVVGASVVLVEGVMGLYDGRSGDGEHGSSAQLAKLLGLPVLLVLDAGKLARTAGALALGCQMFDPDVRIEGVILNRVASARHAAVVRDAVEREAGIAVVGVIPRDERLVLPERYLGLIPMAEGRSAAVFFEAAQEMVERHVDLDRVLTLAAGATTPMPATLPDAHPLFPPAPQPTRARIAVAMDHAFSFYYPDSLDLLRAWGAELVPFSPLRDATLPPRCGAVYIGGGFPELFAAQLSTNDGMRASLRRAAEEGRVIYGECGGLMYLGEALTDADGHAHPMTGLLPVRSTMSRARLTLGYWELTTRSAGPFGPAGRSLRGHEFHWSVPDRTPTPGEALYELAGSRRLEGFQRGSVYGSYVHLHLGSDASLAPAFVQAAVEQSA